MNADLAALTARYGFRFSNLDAERAGVSEHVLHTAVVDGRARIERSFGLTVRNGYPQPLVTTYLVFA